MLSAIAARKAAQAAAQSKPLNSPVKSLKLENLDNNTRPSDSKRKYLTDGSNRRRQKKQKKQTAAPPHARYFAAEALDEVILVDDDDDASSSGANNDEVAKRAWSPSQPPLESSDEDDIELVEGTSGYDLEVPSFSPVDNGYPSSQSLTFVPISGQNVIHISGDTLTGRSGTILALNISDTIALQGVYSVTVLRGAVSVLGSVINASSARHQIFAPKCSPIPIITAIRNSPSSPFFPEELSRRVSPDCTIVLLEDLVTGVEGLGRVCKLFDGVFGDESSLVDPLRLSTARMISSLGRVFLPFDLPSTWERALSTFDMPSSEPPIILVKGPKRTGKSTLARTLLNRLLSRYRRVAFLECDVGQTEFTPPGLVSITVQDEPVFGPPFTHLTLPYASHFIGSTSPRHSPLYYVAAIQALVQTYKLDIQYSCPECDTEEDERSDDSVPLVVNTMGWTKGLGADLALQVEQAIGPTHTFSVGEQSDQPPYFGVEAIPVNAQTTRFSAADWRTISLISYFHSISTQSSHRTWDANLPLTARRPYAIRPKEGLDNVVLIGSGTEDVVPSEVGRVLNGAVVALVACQPGSMDVMEDERFRYSQNSLPPDPSMSSCIGIGFIRAVSPALLDPQLEGEDVLHLLTPLSPSLLSSTPCRCIVKGEIEMPVWAMLDHRDESRAHADNIPYLQWSRSDAIGAERRRVRRNLMRKAQM